MGRFGWLAWAGLLLLLPSCISCQSVVQYHNNGYHDGFYVDPLFNATNINTLAGDPAFNVSIPGPVYAQTLYLANSILGRDVIFVATEQNQVLAIDARTGATLWNRTVGPPVNGAILPCGNIDPSGITGTPVIDARLGILAFVSLTTPNGTLAGIRSLAWALSILDGTVLPGYPVDIQAVLTAQNKTFIAANQQQRGALTLLNGMVYIPYGGLNGDCNEYYGVVVGIPLLAPAAVQAYVSRAYKGGLWSTPGLSTDGVNIFGAAGNTGGLDNFTAPEVWNGGEALLRFQPGPVFTNSTRDFFAPANWQALDDADTDIGSSGALLVDLPQAVPAQLVVAMGKNGVIYLADRNNLGGVGGAVFQAQVVTGVIISTPVAYTTANGTYLALGGSPGLNCPPGQAGDIVGLRLNPGSPPNFTVAWCGSSLGRGRPAIIATSPDGNSTATVWALGTQGSGLLRGFDGVTGQLVYNSTMVFSHLRSWQTPIVAKGRLYFADDSRLYSLKLAGAPELPLVNGSTITGLNISTRGPVIPTNNASLSGSLTGMGG